MKEFTNYKFSKVNALRKGRSRAYSQEEISLQFNQAERNVQVFLISCFVWPPSQMLSLPIHWDGKIIPYKTSKPRVRGDVFWHGKVIPNSFCRLLYTCHEARLGLKCNLSPYGIPTTNDDPVKRSESGNQDSTKASSLTTAINKRFVLFFKLSGSK